MTAALVLLLAGAATYDTAWSEALPAGAEITLPPGVYAGPWRLDHDVTLHAVGASLGAGDAGTALEIVGRARVDGLSVVAPAKGYGIRVEAGGDADLRGVRVSGSAQSLIYVAGGALKLSGGELSGGDYGVLTEAARSLSVKGTTAHGQVRAGLAVVNGPTASAELAQAKLEGPFGEAAIVILHATATLTNNCISNAGAIAIKIINGTAMLTRNQLAGARTDAQGLEGNGLYGYNSKISLDGDRIDDCSGAEISAIGSTTTLSSVRLSRAKETAVYVSGGRLAAKDCRASRSPAGVLLERDAQFDGKGFEFDHVENPIVQLPP